MLKEIKKYFDFFKDYLYLDSNMIVKVFSFMVAFMVCFAANFLT